MGCSLAATKISDINGTVVRGIELLTAPRARVAVVPAKVASAAAAVRGRDALEQPSLF